MKILVLATLASVCIVLAQDKCQEDACSHHCISTHGWEGGFCDEDDCMCFNIDGHVIQVSLIEPSKSSVIGSNVELSKEEPQPLEPKVDYPPKPPVTEPKADPPKKAIPEEEPKSLVTEPRTEEKEHPETEPKEDPTKQEANEPPTKPKSEPPKEEAKPSVIGSKEEPKPLLTESNIEPLIEGKELPATEPKNPPKEETNEPVIQPKLESLKEESKPTLAEPKVRTSIETFGSAECNEDICLAQCEREDWMWGFCHQDMCWCYKKISDPENETKSWNIRKLLKDILNEKRGSSPHEPETVPRAEVRRTKSTENLPGKPRLLLEDPTKPTECDRSICLADCEREDWHWGMCSVDRCWCWEKKYSFYRGKKSYWNIRKLLEDILDEKDASPKKSETEARADARVTKQTKKLPEKTRLPQKRLTKPAELCNEDICLAQCEREDWMWGFCHQDLCWCYKKISNPENKMKPWNIRMQLEDIMNEKIGSYPMEPETVPRTEIQRTKSTEKLPGKPRLLPVDPTKPAECDRTTCLADCEREDWHWGMCSGDRCWCWEKKYSYYHGKKSSWNIRKLLEDILEEK